jgi:hypothetical protein
MDFMVARYTDKHAVFSIKQDESSTEGGFQASGNNNERLHQHKCVAPLHVCVQQLVGVSTE